MTDGRAPRRIAAWSGPRNLSTALMRSFGARGDTVCVDEPFYAAYLAATGLDHPMRAAVIASQPTDWRDALAALKTPVPAPVQYQKHMVQHLLPAMDGPALDRWLDTLTHVVLIRDPVRVVASFAEKRGLPDPAELGFDRQAALFRALRERGHVPVVIDSADIRRAPRAALSALCAAIDLPFTEAMLSWPAGAGRWDGVWGAHWYDAVNASTGFAPAEGPAPTLPPALAALADRLRPAYEAVAGHRLAIDGPTP